MTENEISYLLRGCIFKVHNALGAGLLESAYSAALFYEIEKAGLACRSQVPLPMMYKNCESRYRISIGSSD